MGPQPQRKGARWPALPCSRGYCPASCPTSPLASCALGPCNCHLLAEPALGDAVPNPSPGLRPASSERETPRDGGTDAGWLCVGGEGPLLSGFRGGGSTSLSWGRGGLPPSPAPQALRVWKVGSHAVRSSRTPSCRLAARVPLRVTQQLRAGGPDEGGRVGILPGLADVRGLARGVAVTHTWA